MGRTTQEPDDGDVVIVVNFYQSSESLGRQQDSAEVIESGRPWRDLEGYDTA
ncbi:hypothetical protein [Mycolicibacter arupensis]|nr:hypothetical protein [Mycolicibacter arupensis]